MKECDRIHQDMCNILIRVSYLELEERYKLLKKFKNMIGCDIEMTFEPIILDNIKNRR